MITKVRSTTDPGESGAEPGAERPPWWHQTGPLVAGLTAIVAVIPLGVALVALRDPRWYPSLDMAWTELRLRDIRGGHPPQTGLAGRFVSSSGDWGTHPGPISFYVLWPVYTLFGATAWAMQVAAATLNVFATGVAIWIGKRRGGPALALGVAAALVVLMRLYGASALTEAWNPYMPMLWWLVFLLAVWSVMNHDLALLPVAAVAGTFCVQTHFPYLGLVGGMATLLALYLALRVFRDRRKKDTDPDRTDLARLARWAGVGAALMVVLWLPPVVEQFTHSPGNLGIIADSYRTMDDPTPALRDTVTVWLSHLDIRGFISPVTPVFGVERSAVPGALLLVTWLATAVLCVRARCRNLPTDALGDPRLARLHMVVASALALGLISITRVKGFVWFYLTLGNWGTTALLLLAVGWTATALIRARLPAEGPQQPRALAGLAAVVVVMAALFTVDARAARPTDQMNSATLAMLAPATVNALEGLDDGPILVRWTGDALGIGGQGYGMLLELERQGFAVGADPHTVAGSRPHRLLGPDDADVHLQYVVGADAIAQWEATDGAVKLAEADPRSPDDIVRSEELRDRLADELRAAGAPDLADQLDRNLFIAAVGAAERGNLPDGLEFQVVELMELGLPAAVFLSRP